MTILAQSQIKRAPILRKKLFDILQNHPECHQDPKLREIFKANLIEYFKVSGDTVPTDVIFAIGKELFGLDTASSPLTNNNTMNDDIPVFKVLLIGHGGVGKKQCIQSLIGDGDDKNCCYTSKNIEIFPLQFFTNYGPIRFHAFNLNGTQARDGMHVEFLRHTHAAIYMFDVKSRSTYKDVPRWHRSITNMCKNIPVALAGNALRGPGCSNFKPKYAKQLDIPYFMVDSCHGFEKVYLWIARKLVGHDSLEFVKPPAPQPPTISFDDDSDSSIGPDFANGVRAMLPEDDDDL